MPISAPSSASWSATRSFRSSRRCRIPTSTPKFILPSTADRLARGEDIVGLSLVSALWCRYFAGTSDSGKAIVFNDANADRLQAAAAKAKDDPDAFLVFDDIFGDVSKSDLFRRRFAHALRTLWEKGTRQTLQLYLDGKLAE